MARYQQRRGARDPAYKLLCRMRSRLRAALRRGAGGAGGRAGRTEALVGCSAQELCRHLEARFAPGMTLANHGAWHIDHIVPCAAFDLRDPSQQRACFHWSNLQPLWARDNLVKGSCTGYVRRGAGGGGARAERPAQRVAEPSSSPRVSVP